MNLHDTLAHVHYEPESPLSPDEAALSDEHIAIDNGRLVYERANARAIMARDALQKRLARGVPAIQRLPNGGYDGMVGIRHLEVNELIDAYTRASRVLWNAAQMVCDIENLPDDGELAGIRWEVPMAGRGS